MKTAHKKSALVAILIAAAVWPGIHHLLARTQGIDPWKLFGWSMYAVPNRQIRVKVVALENGAPTHWIFPPAARAEIDRFVERRMNLGRFASAHSLGEAVLEHEPRFDELDVVVQMRRLDLETAHLVFDEERTRVVRSDRSPVGRFGPNAE